MAVHWIDWYFWSWKTLLCLFLINKVIPKISDNYFIISNIKMDKNKVKNYYYFDDDCFLETLRTCNSINDLQRLIYSKVNDWGINIHQRNKYTKFYLFFDESGAILNNQKKLLNNEVYAEYINQNRKNFEEIFIVSVKWAQNNKTIRQMVDWWFYVKPLFDFWIFKHIWVVRKQKRDEEWKVEMEVFLWKDEKGDYISKSKPIDFYYSWFWKPKYWSHYDDLHKNIRDKEKYTWLNKELFVDIVVKNNDLLKLVYENKTFYELKKYFPEPVEEEIKEEPKKTNFIKKIIWL